MENRHKYIYSSLFFVLVLVVGCCVYYLNRSTLPIYNSIHIHADFAIYIDGEKITFDDDLYQSTGQVARHQFQHLHDNQDEVLHIHAKYQSIGDFFSSLEFSLEEDCLYIQTKEINVCREDGLKLFVNGKKYRKNYSSYIPKDLDKFILTNSIQENIIQQQIESISNKACIHSQKCENTTGEKIVESCGVGTDGCSTLPQVVPVTHIHTEVKENPEKIITDIKPNEAKVTCATAGCSGTLCLDKESAADIFTTCEFKPEYVCYRQVSCEVQDSGHCGWSDTEKLSECLETNKE